MGGGGDGGVRGGSTEIVAKRTNLREIGVGGSTEMGSWRERRVMLLLDFDGSSREEGWEMLT